MWYRVCKSFEIESGHMLSKHPGRCRHPHGHTRRIEVVVARRRLDEHDMVCDFKALRLALESYLDVLDHAMLVNSDDPALRGLRDSVGGRLVVFDGEDPTTEALARRIYEHLRGEVGAGCSYADAEGHRYTLPADLVVERVRVWETSSSWAEYGLEPGER
ncbi:MAG: 6-carboxytetrahydropterin synthase [Phycisphaeraceae bacterium]|nr:6-carboxytetrahydropterin synthase [Phycisphaeraceae bacterium]